MFCGGSQVLFAGFKVLEVVVETYPETVFNPLGNELIAFFGQGGSVARTAVSGGLVGWL